MADQPTTKTYVKNCSAKEITFANGNSILKLDFNAEVMTKFIAEHTNDKGRVVLGISKLKEPRLWDDGNVRETHCVWLDNWKPAPKQEQAAQAAKKDGDGIPY